MSVYQGIIRNASRGMGRGDLKIVVKAYTTTNSSYQPGGDQVTLTEVREVKFAHVQPSGGFHAVVPSDSYSGAAFKVKLFYPPIIAKTYTITTTYLPGGITVDANGGLSQVKGAVLSVSDGYVARPTSYSGTAFKVQLYYVPDPTTISGSNSPLTEVASGTDLSGTVLSIVATSFEDNPSELMEVISGTNISGTVYNIFTVGVI